MSNSLIEGEQDRAKLTTNVGGFCSCNQMVSINPVHKKEEIKTREIEHWKPSKGKERKLRPANTMPISSILNPDIEEALVHRKKHAHTLSFPLRRSNSFEIKKEIPKEPEVEPTAPKSRLKKGRQFRRKSMADMDSKQIPKDIVGSNNSLIMFFKASLKNSLLASASQTDTTATTCSIGGSIVDLDHSKNLTSLTESLSMNSVSTSTPGSNSLKQPSILKVSKMKSSLLTPKKVSQEKVTFSSETKKVKFS